MKFTVTIEINKPIDKVVALFNDPGNLLLWMEGLQSFEPISGVPGQPGAKSRLKFKMGKREMEMIETVTVMNLPHEFTGTYEAMGVLSIVKNTFEKVDESRTLYVTDQDFQFKGFMKIIAFLMPGVFKEKTMKHLVSFKNFVESQP